jgi:hypothetical protein
MFNTSSSFYKTAHNRKNSIFTDKLDLRDKKIAENNAVLHNQMKIFESFMKKDYNYGQNYTPTIPEVVSNESILLSDKGSMVFK